MSEEILINVTPRETRVALVENGVLQEVQIERIARRGLVGGISGSVVGFMQSNQYDGAIQQIVNLKVNFYVQTAAR